MNQARRLTPARLADLGRILTERDRGIIDSLFRVRMATGRQLQRLHFVSGPPLSNVRVANKTLDRLVRNRILARLDRRIGGRDAGSAGYVYSLDVAGHYLAQVSSERRRRPWTPGAAFVDHALAVTELFVRLLEAERLSRLELVEFTGEPANWRSYLGSGGERQTLKPDAVIQVGIGSYVDSYFVEVDRGTESVTALDTKFSAYRHYWLSGNEQARDGIFPRVLWLAPSAKRHGALVDAAARQPADAWPIFQVVLYDQALSVFISSEGGPQ